MKKGIFKKIIIMCLTIICGINGISVVPVKAEGKNLPRELKILAIGNSFSVDGMEYLYHIARDAGVKKLILGNLYYPSCTVQMHLENVENNNAVYTYYKNTGGVWDSRDKVGIEEAVVEENWDFIILQQGSGSSGSPETYDDVQLLLEKVKVLCRNPQVVFGWNMTWAYQKGCTHPAFKQFQNNQMSMYKAIVNSVQEKILPDKEISFLIPSGTTIQNARTSFLGDTLNRDGYHLTYTEGRYLSGLTWFAAITEIDLREFDKPLGRVKGVPDSEWSMLTESVMNAVKTPFSITESTYPAKREKESILDTEIDYDNYELLDWQPVSDGYWYCMDAANATTLITKEIYPDNTNFPLFVASKKIFTREDIPVGSIIECDQGYSYLPEGWKNMETQTKRPDSVALERVLVDEQWWAGYKYRAFNVWDMGGAALSGKEEEMRSHFRIYVPKK